MQAAWADEYSLLEADYVTNLAAHDGLVQGMGAYAPLEYGDLVRSYLDSLMTHGTGPTQSSPQARGDDCTAQAWIRPGKLLEAARPEGCIELAFR